MIKRMVAHSLIVTLVALLLIAASIWGLVKAPTGFIPTEDQGYMMMVVQLPNGASLARTQSAMGKLAKAAAAVPGVAHVIQIGGISPIDNNASLANAGVIYVMLKPWDVRGKKEGLLPTYMAIRKAADTVPEANVLVAPPPPIQGLGLASGFQMQIELTDGTFNFKKLQETADALIGELNKSPEIRMALTPFRADVPQLSFEVNRIQARNNNVEISDLFQTLETYVGSSYVNQITKYGYNYYVYVQADTDFRNKASEINNYKVRNQNGQMVPLGSLASIHAVAGPAVASFYNLYPTATIVGAPNDGTSSGQAMKLLEKLAAKMLPQGMSYEWTTVAYQEKLAGSATILVFAMSLVLVYFVLAGQYENWITPLAVILAVPLAVLGTVAVLQIPGMSNNIYVQIGLVLLIALSAKNAILVVEMAREEQAAGRTITEAAVAAACARFRPIMMTSITFVLGVIPLILASGAGANARKMLGLTVASGMIASTCLAVVFVPSFYVLLQKLQERKRS
jgi:HAE1 family hydrophobic/amphiphilic exporter-1